MNVYRIMRYLCVCLGMLSFGCWPPPPNPITITAQDNDYWVAEAAYGAAGFWEKHGQTFLVTEEDAQIRILVTSFEGNTVGQWNSDLTPFYSGRILIESDLQNRKNRYALSSCIIAHELGHAMGLSHTEQGLNLMSPIVTLDEDGNCPWSDTDQQQWCALNPQACDAD